METTNLQVGDLYKHIKSSHIHILTEISKSCVHLYDLSIGKERTIRNDVLSRYWTLIGDNT